MSTLVPAKACRGTHLSKTLLLMWIGDCLHVCLCSTDTHVHGGQKRVSGVLEPELQTVWASMWHWEPSPSPLREQLFSSCLSHCWPSLRLLISIFKKQLDYRPKHSIFFLSKVIILTKLPFLHRREGLSQLRNGYSLKGEASFSLLSKCQQKEGRLGSYCSS